MSSRHRTTIGFQGDSSKRSRAAFTFNIEGLIKSTAN
ncbi:hypothetical protein OROGR_029442 [Orobanche gracilis]